MSNPRNDGIDHINVYSKGKTELGQMMTNSAHIPFEYKGIEHVSFEWINEIWEDLKKELLMDNISKEDQAKAILGDMCMKVNNVIFCVAFYCKPKETITFEMLRSLSKLYNTDTIYVTNFNEGEIERYPQAHMSIQVFQGEGSYPIPGGVYNK